MSNKWVWNASLQISVIVCKKLKLNPKFLILQLKIIYIYRALSFSIWHLETQALIYMGNIGTVYNYEKSFL